MNSTIKATTSLSLLFSLDDLGGLEMSAWNVEDAVKMLNGRAKDHSLGRCAEYTRIAIEAGGVVLKRHISAKDYGSSLLAVGFTTLSPDVSLFKAGDVAIIQPIKGHPHGHMAMFNGKIWISDFKQNHGYYPGPTYRKIKPPVTIYRYGSQSEQTFIFAPVYAVDHSLA